MADRPAYSGILAEPIPQRLVTKPTIAEGDVRAARKLKFIELAFEKTDALCAHYGCDPTLMANKHHVMELGKRYVLGFRESNPKRPGGRRKDWDDFRLAAFFISYLARRDANKTLTERSTLKNMGKDRAFGVGFEQLKQKLPEARESPLVKMMFSDNAEDRKFAWSFFYGHPC